MKENYTMAKFTFPLDKKKFSSKAQMYDYIERTYPHLLSDDMPASRLYFNLKYNKTVGRSVISGKPTKWNPITERYERFANDHEKALYVKEFKARMKAKYGKEHLLGDPNKQKEMLSNRTISIDYRWQDGTVSRVTSKLERDFLDYLESVYHFTPDMLCEPPTIYYKDGERASFYLPDFYIPSLNLIVEIKGSNKHYQERDSYKEVLKAEATKKEGFNFLQIQDNYFNEFNLFFKENVLEKA